jgi:catechol-2,3-dioxygenase
MKNTKPAQVIKLGFVGLNAVRREEMRHYYEEVVGLPLSETNGRNLYFSCGGCHRAVSLHDGERPGIRHIGLQIAGEGALDDVCTALSDHGVKARLLADHIPGLANCIEIVDADGYVVYLYREGRSHAPPSFGDLGIGPVKLGHIALYVRDAKATSVFYTAALGLRWSDWVEDKFVFMRCGSDHHTLNFLRSAKRGMFHFAFQLRDWAHIGTACDFLARQKFKLLCGPGRHGLGHNLYLYHRDPDGNIVEMFADMDVMSNEELGYFDPRPHHEEFPLRPKIWPDTPETGDIWGVPVPNGFLE